MAHTSIEPTDADRYYAGDAIDIPFEFTYESGTAIDITNATIEFRIKENLTDADADAVVTKSSNNTDANGNPEIEFTDATNGKCLVHILTDDTASVVNDGSGNRLESVVMDWHARVIDSSGSRVTSETGDWEVFAS